MISELFNDRLKKITTDYNNLIKRKNEKLFSTNGIYEKYKYPVITTSHTPLIWRYDFNEKTNPYFMERLGVNSTFNPGAIELDGMIYLVVRVEGVDRKSFFAIAESDNGIDNFKFWDFPILLPEIKNSNVNVYDMRLVKHEDGWIYGLFCTERKDPAAPKNETSSAEAQCDIVRTKDPLRSRACVEQRYSLTEKNLEFIEKIK